MGVSVVVKVDMTKTLERRVQRAFDLLSVICVFPVNSAGA
jgi:hypothetical protein